MKKQWVLLALLIVSMLSACSSTSGTPVAPENGSQSYEESQTQLENMTNESDSIQEDAFSEKYANFDGTYRYERENGVCWEFVIDTDLKEYQIYEVGENNSYRDKLFSGTLYERNDTSLQSDSKGGWVFTLENGNFYAGNDEDPEQYPCTNISAEKQTETYDNTETKTPTTGEINALASALLYLQVSSFSYSGLIDQLEYEGYTEQEAKYGADYCGADWNEQAAKSAKSYLDILPFSRSELIEQLEYEGFTHDQAVYGVEQNGY